MTAVRRPGGIDRVHTVAADQFQGRRDGRREPTDFASGLAKTKLSVLRAKLFSWPEPAVCEVAVSDVAARAYQ